MAARRVSKKKSARSGATPRRKSSAGKAVRKRAAASKPARSTAKKKRPAATTKRASRATTKSTPKSAKPAPKLRPQVTKTLALMKKTAAKKTVAAAAPAAPAVAAKRAPRAKPRDTRKPVPTPAFTPAFEPQRQIANPKELLLFELQRARVAVMASIQGITGGTADRPTAPGKWSVREIVLHLIVRDRVRLDEFASVLGGARPSWTNLDETAMARMNELHLGPLRPLSWDEAVRLLQATREQLMSALISVSSYPSEMWTDAHPFGAMLRALPVHDRHHAEQIKNARIEG